MKRPSVFTAVTRRRALSLATSLGVPAQVDIKNMHAQAAARAERLLAGIEAGGRSLPGWVVFMLPVRAPAQPRAGRPAPTSREGLGHAVAA